MTHQDAGPGVRVRVTGNTTRAKRPDSNEYLQVGDEITLTGGTFMSPNSMKWYYDRGSAAPHFVKITEIELVDPEPSIDIWQAARKYIRIS